ncbi:16S rRNA m(7)G-527 methyltransferase [Marinitoga hydrogenitolerans DSM 16785]|uniref:Ribosomal RNA small subunit methyltransferase G n=1 Tax=Marinitoga hydrogenitolerans (strain DSM 16785 / JCM 12826 / AT1271) TaxID=1122195 RepID=A0A1M4V207_MARH1|nr:16S rRNA (guanine(527)-N(7))-methyltransferase RsmG [Marinitoga hydrogenitolerans]SHE62969.1 16S rRNA m(7)G-527 methyltransferase [Marinitoga hydrogenitolerans DSM 16785]
MNFLLKLLENYEISLNESSYNKLNNFIELIINYPVNLTAIKEFELAAKYLVLDSIYPFLKYTNLKNDTNFLDIGTGGGIPGIPLSIIFPFINFTLLDSIEKKIKAVNFFSNELKLKNINTVNERVEIFSKQNISTYDYATAKAVSRSDILLEYAAPLLKIGGFLFLYKGPTYISDEKKYLEKAIKKIYFEIIEEFHYNVFEKERYFIILKKIGETPSSFPRKIGMALKKPLGGI